MKNGSKLSVPASSCSTSTAAAGEKVQAQSVEVAWQMILQVLGAAKATLWKHQQIQVAAGVIQRLVDAELAKGGKKWSLMNRTPET